MPDINLLQPEAQKKEHGVLAYSKKSGSILVWITVALIAVEAGLWGGLYWWQTNLVDDLQKTESDVANLDLQIIEKKSAAEPAVSAQSALISIKSLLDEHIYLSHLWKELGKTALKNAQYLGLGVTTAQDKFLVKGEVESYTTLGKVMLGLATSSNFESVDLVSSGPAGGERVAVAFEIEVVVKHSLVTEAEE